MFYKLQDWFVGVMVALVFDIFNEIKNEIKLINYDRWGNSYDAIVIHERLVIMRGTDAFDGMHVDMHILDAPIALDKDGDENVWAPYKKLISWTV